MKQFIKVKYTSFDIIHVLSICSFMHLISIFLLAQNFPPQPSQWVMDYPGLLKNEQVEQLNRYLQAYEDSTTNQIIVAIFQDAQGYPVEDFSISLAERWQVGQKGKDNGIILAVFLEERKIRVEVGYGLEDKIPDAIAYQIAQNVISPYFKNNNYYMGLKEGLDFLIDAASGKFKADQQLKRKKEGTRIPFFLIFFLIIFILSMLGRRNRATVGSRGWRRTGPFFWGGFGGGFRGGGGFGGGGFSAGGGGFGGGGATGSW
jgi:uncharacterized protein